MRRTIASPCTPAAARCTTQAARSSCASGRASTSMPDGDGRTARRVLPPACGKHPLLLVLHILLGQDGTITKVVNYFVARDHAVPLLRGSERLEVAKIEVVPHATPRRQEL
eukprot:Rhum_TRINITY_DN26134_c0_g1::Rhum_TRINITY_DN26134_c0_g1_i1::g.183310::m.183310